MVALATGPIPFQQQAVLVVSFLNCHPGTEIDSGRIENQNRFQKHVDRLTRPQGRVERCHEPETSLFITVALSLVRYENKGRRLV